MQKDQQENAATEVRPVGKEAQPQETEVRPSISVKHIDGNIITVELQAVRNTEEEQLEEKNYRAIAMNYLGVIWKILFDSIFKRIEAKPRDAAQDLANIEARILRTSANLQRAYEKGEVTLKALNTIRQLRKLIEICDQLLFLDYNNVKELLDVIHEMLNDATLQEADLDTKYTGQLETMRKQVDAKAAIAPLPVAKKKKRATIRPIVTSEVVAARNQQNQPLETPVGVKLWIAIRPLVKPAEPAQAMQIPGVYPHGVTFLETFLTTEKSINQLAKESNGQWSKAGINKSIHTTLRRLWEHVPPEARQGFTSADEAIQTVAGSNIKESARRRKIRQGLDAQGRADAEKIEFSADHLTHLSEAATRRQQRYREMQQYRMLDYPSVAASMKDEI